MAGIQYLSFVQPAYPLAYDFRLPIGAIHYGRAFRTADTAVYYQIDNITEFLVNQFRVCAVFNVLIVIMRQCSCHDGSIQQAGYFLNDGIVRHTDADLLTVTEYLGQAGGAVQNEGESSGQITLHQLEGAVVHFGVFADLAQVVADDGKIVLLGVDVLEAADALDGALLQSVAADGIHGVGRVDKDTSVIQ